MVRLATWVLTCAFALSSCAGLEAVTVTGGKDRTDNDVKGFRYYDSAPFLFVHSDGKGGITGEVVWLPDISVKRSVRPYAYLASNDATLKFTNGTLSQASANVDETVIPNAIVKALTSIVTAGIQGATTSASRTDCPKLDSPPYLYRIEIKGEQITLQGGPPPAVCPQGAAAK